ncbi:MAG TPA: hypothetical protein VFP91_23110 [Vicinamibacterales bacterium]|nr:hypothetical protein [Vicinamibacterales bacterium]
MAALVLFVLATAWKSGTLGTIAWMLSAPTCLWISGYPRIRFVGLLVLACNAGGVFALFRGRRFAAATLWFPFALVAFVLGVLFFRHPF